MIMLTDVVLILLHMMLLIATHTHYTLQLGSNLDAAVGVRCYWPVLFWLYHITWQGVSY
jgi:hypothetical protein